MRSFSEPRRLWVKNGPCSAETALPGYPTDIKRLTRLVRLVPNPDIEPSRRCAIEQVPLHTRGLLSNETVDVDQCVGPVAVR